MDFFDVADGSGCLGRWDIWNIADVDVWNGLGTFGILEMFGNGLGTFGMFWTLGTIWCENPFWDGFLDWQAMQNASVLPFTCWGNFPKPLDLTALRLQVLSVFQTENHFGSLSW